MFFPQNVPHHHIVIQEPLLPGSLLCIVSLDPLIFQSHIHFFIEILDSFRQMRASALDALQSICGPLLVCANLFELLGNICQLRNNDALAQFSFKQIVTPFVTCQFVAAFCFQIFQKGCYAY